MADNYAHQYNARNAMKIAGYTPRCEASFILGANGPDPLFCYQMYNPLRRYHLSKLGTLMHNRKTGLFLQNLFRLAATDAQKDYCLGFLCHYALDSTIHPYVNYVTSAYGSPFNIPSGHGYFESALDSYLSMREEGLPSAHVDRYFPEINDMQLNQVIALFKKAVDITYPEHQYPRSEYLQAFKDFRLIKTAFCSHRKFRFPVMYFIEKVLRFEEGFVVSHLQPCQRKLPDFTLWYNEGAAMYSVEKLDDIMLRADYLAAEHIDSGLEYFRGLYSTADLLEAIGNKSYETGIVID